MYASTHVATCIVSRLEEILLQIYFIILTILMYKNLFIMLYLLISYSFYHFSLQTAGYIQLLAKVVWFHGF